MLTAIAILSGIGFVLHIIKNAIDGEFDTDPFHASVLIISCWSLCFPISIIAIILVILMVWIKFVNK